MLGEYEYIYCTMRPYSLLLLPIIIKLLSKKNKVLIDFRFLFYMEAYYYKGLGMTNYLYWFFDRWLLSKSLKASDYRIALTSGLAEKIGKTFDLDFTVIEQGYDSDERDLACDHKEKVHYYLDNMINIVYTGSVTPTQADPKEMADIVSVILSHNRRVVFHFFGLVGSLQKRLFECDRVYFYDYLNYKQFVDVVRRADIVFIYYSNNSLNDHRIGTKTYDYMNFSKPILCYCSQNQLTFETLKNYNRKHVITNNYHENSLNIDFDKLMENGASLSNDHDVHELYKAFLELEK